MDVENTKIEKVLTVQEVAAIAKVSINTAYEWFKRADFPKVPDSRINKITYTAFRFWLMGINYYEFIRQAVEKEVKKDFRR